jgi:hypothetical protein
VWFDNASNASAVVDEALKIAPASNRSETTQLFDLLRKANAYPAGTILDTSALDTQMQTYVSIKAAKSLPVSQWADVTYAQKAKAGA